LAWRHKPTRGVTSLAAGAGRRRRGMSPGIEQHEERVGLLREARSDLESEVRTERIARELETIARDLKRAEADLRAEVDRLARRRGV
jgi:hypothetical protein